MSILYFSKNCPNSAEFLKRLKEENMLGAFDEYFCIDNQRNLPNFLHSVPTIVVPESPTKPLIGDDVFAWLNYKLNQKYKQQELVTLDETIGDNFCSLDNDPENINCDSGNYISIENIGRPIKPDVDITNIDNASFDKRLKQLEMERSNFNQAQGQQQQPRRPNFQY